LSVDRLGDHAARQRQDGACDHENAEQNPDLAVVEMEIGPQLGHLGGDGD
jgi:hypothetical protein